LGNRDVTPPTLLITHERLARWARQLRARLAGLPIELVETRSRADLLHALARHPAPLLLLDLEHRPIEALDDLEAAMAAVPEVRALVLDPGRLPEVPGLCREVGAVEVLSGPVPPPVIAGRLARLLALSRERFGQDGWCPPGPRRGEPGLDALDAAHVPG
jgi:hypothetical protein